ncbi:MAG: hypothetical protein ABW321_00345 [Polyangiales bacterium]
MRSNRAGFLALLGLIAACGSDGAAPAGDPGTTPPTGSGGVTAPVPAGGGAGAASTASGQTGAGAAAGGAGAVAGSTGATAGTSSSAAGGGSVASPAGSGAAGATPPGPDATAGTGAAGDSAGAAGAAAAGTGANQGPVEACDPADQTAEAEDVPLESIRGSSNPAPIAPAKGPLKPVIEHDPGLSTHTVYRPAELGDAPLPIVVWANGGCIKNGTMFSRFLLEIASHGYVIVADGEPNGSGMGPLETNGEPQKQALDWITAENERPCSKFYRKLDTTKIAAMGQSCGGLMTMGISGDKRLSTVVIWNSGMFERDEAIYAGLHAPMAYFIGGMEDVAYAQAEEDFAAIETVPLFYGNAPVGHMATYSEDNGGLFAQVGIAWLNWQLKGDQTDNGGKKFEGPDCGLCKDSMWTIEKKNMQ